MIKLSQEEIKQLQQTQSTANQIIFALGQLSIQKLELEEQYKGTIATQNELAKQLEGKYGEGQINIETGEFIPSGSNSIAP